MSPNSRPEAGHPWAGPRGDHATLYPAGARARLGGGAIGLRHAAGAAKTEVARLPSGKGSKVRAPAANGLTSLTVVPDPGLGEAP
jgi:hypothetical protein